MEPIKAVVFDIGGVLIEWDPRNLYRRLFADAREMERFLSDVCTLEWHAAHDRGVGYEENAAPLIARHPQYADAIRAWGQGSAEMEGGEIAGTVELLRRLVAKGVPVYALTNMEADTYPRRLEQYPFLRWFAGTVVSYQEGVVKPDPEIFRRLIDRFELRPERTLLIDDAQRNVEIAAGLGFQTIQFKTPPRLATELERLGLLGEGESR